MMTKGMSDKDAHAAIETAMYEADALIQTAIMALEDRNLSNHEQASIENTLAVARQRLDFVTSGFGRFEPND